MKKSDAKTVSAWKRHLQDEVDAAFLYHALAEVETEAKPKDILRRMASVEERHAAMLRELMESDKVEVTSVKPSARARFLVWFSRHFNRRHVYDLMLREEGREVKSYLNLSKNSSSELSRKITGTLAKESIQHTRTLREITSFGSEPWHKTQSGGFLRVVVYGFNDGLTANFGLVAGVIGAAVNPQIVLISGLAGTVADALSMGSSGYLAAKSEEEVYAHEIAMEKEEISLMPDLEKEELALIYESKGIDPEQAMKLAEDIIGNPQRTLEEMSREELGIGESHTTPLREGVITGIATAIGAIIPVAPFIFLSGTAAVWTAFALAMISHFGVGAARNIFTGRGVIRSGFDMFVVGLGVAGVAYFIGDLIVRLFR